MDGPGLLLHVIELHNRPGALLRRGARETGIHTRPGGDRDSVHSADVHHNNPLPEMFRINAGYFLIRLASEHDEDQVCESIGQHSRDDQMYHI